MAKNEMLNNYNALRKNGGYRASPSYPTDFQATELPLLVKGGAANMLGNNQAFFFVSNPKGNTDPEKMELNTSKLKELLRNILKNDTQFTLSIDADTLKNPSRFVDKYQGLRGEPDESTRRALLAKEVKLIGDFVNSGGIISVAKEVVAENTGVPPDKVDLIVHDLLQHNFSLRGVVTDKPMANALWYADAPNGALCAKQEYAANTHNTSRKWELGTEMELKQMKAQGNEGAQSLLTAMEGMLKLQSVNMTLGNPGQDTRMSR